MVFWEFEYKSLKMQRVSDAIEFWTSKQIILEVFVYLRRA